jgi:predicted flap endonuclease-1-like 5' DNA nuclease
VRHRPSDAAPETVPSGGPPPPPLRSKPPLPPSMRPQPPSLRPQSPAPHAPPPNLPPPSNVPVPTGSSLPTPVNLLVQPPAMSQPPSTLVHPLGGSSQPPGVVSQPPRPSHAPNTVPSGGMAIDPETRLQQLQSQVMRGRQELVAAQVELRTTRGEAYNLRAELSVAKARIEELESELRRAQSDRITTPGDDLKSIKGIGPKFEKLLRGAGIVTLAQIAAWTESDIDSMAQKLGVKAERIRKDDWVGNAKRLISL